MKDRVSPVSFSVQCNQGPKAGISARGYSGTMWKSIAASRPTIEGTLKSALRPGATVLMAVAAASLGIAGDIVVEATGTVLSANPSGSSPFSSAAVGDPVTVHFEVFVPGMDIVPGQLTSYTIDAAASYVEINLVRDAVTGGTLAIQNDFPVADGIRVMGAPLMGGGGASLEVSESTGTLFGSTDITMEAGSWPRTTWASYSFGVFGGGSFIEFDLPTVTIMEPAFGSIYCAPVVPNSTGLPGSVSASGSPIAALNDLTVTATDLPPSSFGYFIVSDTQGFVMNPAGSQGNLCVSGDIGRFIGQIQSSGPLGTISVVVDLDQIPQPNGPVMGSAGDAWNFQCWHRDANPGATSNFTNAVEVVLQ